MPNHSKYQGLKIWTEEKNAGYVAPGNPFIHDLCYYSEFIGSYVGDWQGDKIKALL